MRAKHPTQADRVLWGLLYAAGLRTEEALAVGWSNFLELSRARCTLEVDRVFVSDHIRHTTKTGRGRDQEIVAPLAADLIELREKVPPGSSDALVCSSRTGTPVNLNNWRNRVFNPAAIAGNSPEVIWKHNAWDRSVTHGQTGATGGGAAGGSTGGREIRSYAGATRGQRGRPLQPTLERRTSWSEREEAINFHRSCSRRRSRV